MLTATGDSHGCVAFFHFELRAARRKSSQYPKQIKSLGDHIRVRRLDLKLLQKQVADCIGVDKITITNWEHRPAVPAIRYMPAIIQFLGTTLTHVQRSDLPLSTKARKNTHSDVRLGLWKVFHQRFAFARRPARGCGLPSLPTHFGMYNNPINQTS